jgi:hypothetical protein
MSSSASDDEDVPPQGAQGVLSARQALSALIAEGLAIGGAFWGAKDILPFEERPQQIVLYFAIFALSAMIAFALARVDRRTRLRGVFASGTATAALLLTLAIIAAHGNPPPPAAGAAPSPATPTAAPTQTSTPAEPPPPTPPRTSPRPAPDVSVADPLPRSTGCQERLRYRVTEGGNVVDADKQPIGWAEEGEIFILLDEPVHVDNRRYGTVGGDTGYVLMLKLERAGTVCV